MRERTTVALEVALCDDVDVTMSMWRSTTALWESRYVHTYGTPNATKIRKSTSEFRKSIIVFTKSISEFGKSIIVFTKWIVVFAKSITEFDYRVCKIDLSCLQNRLERRMRQKSENRSSCCQIDRRVSSVYNLLLCLCMHLHLSNLYYSIYNKYSHTLTLQEEPEYDRLYSLGMRQDLASFKC